MKRVPQLEDIEFFFESDIPAKTHVKTYTSAQCLFDIYISFSLPPPGKVVCDRVFLFPFFAGSRVF